MQADHAQPSTNPPPEPDPEKKVRYGYGVESVCQLFHEEARNLFSHHQTAHK